MITAGPGTAVTTWVARAPVLATRSRMVSATTVGS